MDISSAGLRVTRLLLGHQLALQGAQGARGGARTSIPGSSFAVKRTEPTGTDGHRRAAQDGEGAYSQRTQLVL
ncbi:hypothetical protein [Streptomyces caniferus]|uniref:hypothetical protein n=1 Tax=Streptomyces caniferus TaxID=285557 RepID=UPI003823E137